MNQIELLNHKVGRLTLENDKVYEKIRRELAFRVEGVQYTQAYKNGWDGFTYLLNQKREFPIGLLSRIENLLKEDNIDYTIIDKRKEISLNKEIDISGNLNKIGISFYPYQKEAIEMTSIKNRGIYRVATGGGKSFLAAGITAKLNKPTIILVIGLQLLDQFHRDFSQLFDEEIGYIGNGKSEIKRINIASIWTLAKALNISIKDLLDDDDELDEEVFDESQKAKIIDCLKSTEVFILDECHYTTTQSVRNIYQSINPEYFYGLSGTPYREDNTQLLSEGLIGPKLLDVPASLLIDQGILVRPYIKFIDVPTLKIKGQYQTVYKEYIVENEERNSLIKDNTIDLISKGYRPFCLFKQIKHGDILSDLFDDNNIKFGLLSGKDSLDKRNKIIQQFKDKKIDLILASNIFDIGVNVREVSGLILASGGKSRLRSLQRIGRVIRSFPDKKMAAVVDFYDNCKYLKNHSLIRYQTYCAEEGFKVFPSKSMKD